MKNYTTLFIILCFFTSLKAQLVYRDAKQFPIYGKATEMTGNRYERLPDSLKRISREPVWRLSRNSAGLAIRFCSNSTTIAAKWETLNNNLMNHMTPTGTKGLDLYAWVDGTWKFVNCGRPTGKVNEATIIAHMKPVEREYMLYLPLYDGIVSLSIGIDSLSSISAPRIAIPERANPIVFYGTSILQGGCANRPGMAHTNIISRRLNREIINLGFSGNALLDYEIAHVMAAVDAGAYVLDFVPNAFTHQIYEKTETFYRILRNKHPDTPIIFIEDPVFTHTLFDTQISNEVKQKNKAINSVFDSLKAKGEKNIYMISSKEMLGKDGEATIDGIHFTDLGMMRYADLVCPVIKKVLKNITPIK